MADKIFPEGLNLNKKTTQYGDIIKVGINYEKFVDWLAKYINERGYINLDIKTGQSGKMYAELNTYRKENKEETTESDNIVSFSDEEIPF